MSMAWTFSSLRVIVRGFAIPRILRGFCLLVVGVFAAGTVHAQSGAVTDDGTPSESSNFATPAPTPPTSVSGIQIAASPLYVPPTEEQKFHSYAWNALGPVAFAGSSFAAAIDQSFNFPHEWGQGMDAYGARVASNLGISLVTATSQYAIGEALREDTAYYRCACAGFLPRFWHAALSTVAGRRGADGHTSFSVGLTASPFIGPMVAANTWIPTRHGLNLGFHMGEHNLLGQFGQDEALEFLYGGPNTLMGRIQRHFSKKSSGSNFTP